MSAARLPGFRRPSSDWLKLIATAILVIAASLEILYLLGPGKTNQWFVLAGTVYIFGHLYYFNRNRLSSPVFWAISVIFLAAHTAFWLWLIAAVPGWRPVWSMAMVIELWPIQFAVGWLVPRGRAARTLDGSGRVN